MPLQQISYNLELARRFLQANNLTDAEEVCREIVAIQPHAEALRIWALIAHRTGRFDLSIDLHHRALQLNPEDATSYCNLGESYRMKQCIDEAVSAFERAICLDAQFPEAFSNLGHVLTMKGRIDEAVQACRRAIELRPQYPIAINNLGIAFAKRGDYLQAISAFTTAIELNPQYTQCIANLAAALTECGRLDEALSAYTRAMELNPHLPYVHNNLGDLLRQRGDLDGALREYRHALEAQPNSDFIQSNISYLSLFLPNRHELGFLADEPTRIAAFRDKGYNVFNFKSRGADTKRRLRVGYLSPDFRDHVVGRNLVPLLRNHENEEFEIFCYSDTVVADFTTEKMQLLAHRWHSVVGISDSVLANRIYLDEIDILVDLTQHMAGNRLPMFTRQPAPVQVSFAGYPESTGLDAIGCRISDRYLESNRPDSGTGRKEDVYLIDSFWCYDPCGVEIEVSRLPTENNGRITFGSLNNFCKVNEPVLKLWARVLGSVKDSRLVLLSYKGSHRQRTVEFLEKEGIEPQRIEFVEPRPRREYLELYQRLDIALDPFPYNGHTTSLDALWMGVPVVSLCGERPVSRAGLSQLTNLGLPELIAHSEDEYVTIATQLAHDPPRLTELRTTLRPRMEASVLMDGPRFARQIENAYRTMWRQWCSEQQS